MLVTRDFVFVHIPKTGGSFIQAAIAEHLPVIDHAAEIDGPVWSHTPHSSLPSRWRQLPAFCVIRNPWGWYVSWFHYQMERGPRANEADPWGKRAVWEGAMRGGEADFKEAVTLACTGDFDHPLTPVMRAQGLDFYSARVREIAGAALDRPDFTVLRFERSLRKQVLRYLRAHTEVPRGLAAAIRNGPPSRTSKHGHYTEYYDDELRDLVADKTAWLCDRFGYRYGRGERHTPGSS